MATSVGPDGIAVSGYGWTNQSSTFNSNKSLESYGAPNSSLFNSAAQNGYAAWSIDIEDAVTAVNFPTSTHLMLTRVYVPTSATVGHVDVNFTTSGTVSALYAGIYSASGTLLGSSAESHAAIVTNALTPLALSASVNLTGGQFYYVGITATWSVQPVLAGITMASIYVANANLTAATANTADAGVNATLPSTITMSSNTLLASELWVGLRA